MSYEPIVSVIKNRRIEQGMNQKQLAAMSGMSEKTYQRIESGVADMRMSQYRSIINALRLSDLDVSLDLLHIDKTTPWDVAAAARVLLPQTRQSLVTSIMAEWQRKERQIDAILKIKDGP